MNQGTQIIGQNQYETIMNELRSSVYEYSNNTKQINAFDFFLSNYDICKDGYYCTTSDKAYPLFQLLEKFDLVKKTPHINFFYRETYTFSLTQYGIDFYNSIPLNKFNPNYFFNHCL